MSNLAGSLLFFSLFIIFFYNDRAAPAIKPVPLRISPNILQDQQDGGRNFCSIRICSQHFTPDTPHISFVGARSRATVLMVCSPYLGTRNMLCWPEAFDRSTLIIKHQSIRYGHVDKIKFCRHSWPQEQSILEML